MLLIVERPENRRARAVEESRDAYERMERFSNDLRARVKSYFYGDERKKIEDLLAKAEKGEISKEQLLDAFLPHVPRRTRFEGRAAPFDVTRARELFGFEPRHIWPVGVRDLDQASA
jgi:nucleoside-diphosphate-sugar epimerase